MIDLGRHIAVLLLSNDCVIVPNFGGFMAHRIDAAYDEADCNFVPPLRTLGFNSKLRMNDSLLVQSYIEAYDISYPEALRRIESEVVELKQHIANDGRYELSGIGQIVLNDSGKYIFEPCEAGVLTPSLYGLGTFEMKAVGRHRSKPKTGKNAIFGEANQHTARLVSLLHEGKDAKSARPARKESLKVNMLRNVAAACLLVVAFFLFPSQISNQQSASVLQSNVETGLLKAMMPQAVTIEPTAKTKTETEKTTAPESYYCLVLASQVTQKNAEIFVKELNAKGIAARTLQLKGQSNKVVYGQFEKEGDAYRELNQLHSNDTFSQAWVLHVKNK